MSAFDGVIGLEMALLKEQTFDLIFYFDVMRPGMDGLEVCRKFVKKSISSFIIMLSTAREDEVDKVLGLELGAGRLHRSKPYSMRELTARVLSFNLRRSKRVSLLLRKNLGKNQNTIIQVSSSINVER